jgi:hypothetical protein
MKGKTMATRLPTKRGNPGKGDKPENLDPDLTPEEAETKARQHKLTPLVRESYLKMIGKPSNFMQANAAEIRKGLWRLTVYGSIKTEFGVGVRVVDSNRVTVDNEGTVTGILPALSKGRHFPMTDVGNNGKKW